MASQQAMQEDQLLELLLQLKKTTPEQAKAILLQQPQIAYALLAIMVNINALDMGIVQRTIAEYGVTIAAAPTSAPAAPTPAPAPISTPAPAPVPTPMSAIPPHLAPQLQYRGGTPTYPPAQPAPYGAPSYPPAGPPVNSYAPPMSSAPGPGPVPGYGTPPVAPPPPANNMLSSALAGIPDDQKALVLRVVQMTREEVWQLPYGERENIIKLRATLGLPT